MKRNVLEDYKYHSVLPPLQLSSTTTMSTGTQYDINAKVLAPRIPPELYRPIVEYIQDLGTLHSLSLSSQVLRYEAEPHLYACMPKSSDSSIPSQLSFLATVICNPRLAALVREYHSYEIVKYRGQPLWDLTCTALRCMVNLKVLNFRTFSGRPAAAELLVGCPFRLEKLHWGCHSDEEAIVRVLDEQQDLRELYLSEGREGHTFFSRNACPNLVALGGNRVVIETLLPERRITKLSWVPELDDSITDPIIGMDTELGNLHTLSFGGYFSRPSFGLLAHKLKSLQVLELIGLDSMTELDLMKHLPALRELVLSPRWGYPLFPIALSERPHIIQTLFRQCQSLICIDIAHDWPAVGVIRYQRWNRFLSEPSLVTLAKVRSRRFMQ